MEEINLLKQKYNDLLQSYTKGQEYLKEKPDDEKAQNKLLKIGEEMENILKAIPEKTEKDISEGFVIEEVITEPQDAKIVENASSKKQDAPMQLTTVKKESTLQNFNNNWEIATKLSASTLLPDEFQNHPENVLIAMNMAQKMDMDFFVIAQNLHLIKGRLSWSGSFCKTLIEKTGQYKDLDLIYVGTEGKDDYGCYLEATRVRDGKRIKGNTVTVDLAKREGWWSKKDKYGKETSKWSTMTSQMLGYRAMAFFARLYVPEALNGIMTSEENMDIDYQRENPVDIL